MEGASLFEGIDWQAGMLGMMEDFKRNGISPEDVLRYFEQHEDAGVLARRESPQAALERQDPWLQLYTSCQMNDIRGVRRALERGADVNFLGTPMGTSALHCACQASDLAIVRVLVDAGANVNLWNEEGVPPLLMAAQHDRLEVVKFMLDRGADQMAATDVGWTPLRVACQNGCAATARLLLARGGALDPPALEPYDRERELKKKPAIVALLREFDARYFHPASHRGVRTLSEWHALAADNEARGLPHACCRGMLEQLVCLTPVAKKPQASLADRYAKWDGFGDSDSEEGDL